MVKVVILGSKEYPFGTNRHEDPIPSGGMETYVDDLVPELSKLCKLVIITRKFRGTKSHEKLGNIEVLRVPWLKGRWLRNPSFNCFSGIAAMKCMRNTDIIYSNGIISGIVALKLGKLFGKKTVYRPAGIGFTQFGFPLRQLLFALEYFVFRHSDAVIFHSDGEKRNAQKLFGMPMKNGHVILTGFPVNKFRNLKKPKKKPFGLKNETVITSVCRFVPVKGLDLLLRAFAETTGKCRLLLVGSGPEEKRLRQFASKLGMKDKAIFTGFRRDIPELLTLTDIFVVSSLSEGLPTSLLEAMAAGKACVVTDIGLPVEDGNTGIVVEPGNAEALERAIEKLLLNPQLRKKLGQNAAKFVKENCTTDKAARAHMHVFREVLGE